MVKLTVTGPYTAKDQRKADLATKFIGQGSAKSSTNQYAKDFGVLANCGRYDPTDRVFVSVEGNRPGRKDLNYQELGLALRAGATIIADKYVDRERAYNVGERQLSQYLKANNYHETSDGIWEPKPQPTKSIKETNMKTFTGIEYLAIDLANHYGLDKLVFEERIQWVKDNWSNLEALADKADEPMLYKKAVMNIRRAARGEKTGHMVALDAACSGIQIMSALTGCHKGAYATGLIDPDLRADAYSLTQEAMNNILGLEGEDAISIERKKVKEAVMTACYGSRAKPKELFGTGELLETFYKAVDTTAEGAFNLLVDLMNTWQPYAYSHSWTMPDGDWVNIKVMQLVEDRLEIDELDHYQMTTQYRINQGKKKGVSNVANIVHSIDAYILRTMVRRCNYNPEIMKVAISNITAELMIRYPNYQLGEMSEPVAAHYSLYQQTNMLDTAIVPYLTIEQCESLPTDYLVKLNQLLSDITSYPTFTIEAVHDAFMCLPNNCNRMRYWYKEILAELAESTVLQYIIGTIMGQTITYRKYSDNLAEKIRQSNYAIS